MGSDMMGVLTGRMHDRDLLGRLLQIYGMVGEAGGTSMTMGRQKLVTALRAMRPPW